MNISATTTIKLITHQKEICLHFTDKMAKLNLTFVLGAALRFFAGGLYLDITISHAIGKTDVYCSVWSFIHAANQCPSLQFKFPTTVAECKEVVEEFTF